MLAGAGPGHVFVRFFLAAHAFELVVVNIFLLAVTAVAADGNQGDADFLLAGGKHIFQGRGGLRPHAAQGTAYIRLHQGRHIVLADAVGSVNQKKRALDIPLRRQGLQRGSKHQGSRA